MKTDQAEPSVNLAASSRQRLMAVAKDLFASNGFEHASTASIARLAKTSESQLIKHFGSKQGLLDEIFLAGWGAVASKAREAIQSVTSPREKLVVLSEIMLATLDTDPSLKHLMLLEARRVRKEGHAVSLTNGFLDFVLLIDEVVYELRSKGQLREHLHPQAVRSALLGMMEGLLRDQFLAQRTAFPATYTAADIVVVVGTALDSFLVPEPYLPPI